jgi:hypothetical protein
MEMQDACYYGLYKASMDAGIMSTKGYWIICWSNSGSFYATGLKQHDYQMCTQLNFKALPGNEQTDLPNDSPLKNINPLAF